jgi:hypothetical protein
MKLEETASLAVVPELEATALLCGGLPDSTKGEEHGLLSSAGFS